MAKSKCCSSSTWFGWMILLSASSPLRFKSKTSSSYFCFFFFSSKRRHTIYIGDWSSDVCSSDLLFYQRARLVIIHIGVGLQLFHQMIFRQEVPCHHDEHQPAIMAYVFSLRERVQQMRHRSEERRVGKESRSRWSPCH